MNISATRIRDDFIITVRPGALAHPVWVVKCALRLQPPDKLCGRPVSCRCAYGPTEGTAGTNIFRKGVFVGDIRTVLIFLQSFLSILTGGFYGLWCRGKCFRCTVGCTAELDYPLFRRARILKRHGRRNILRPFCRSLGARCRRFCRAFALCCRCRTASCLCRLRGCRRGTALRL
ncbi:hypothetical protein BvCmsKSNP016_04665 [Escherichia coli]|nr:hypothetical protein BvCmsKSNP016_04665 [Escherichia coli]